MIICYGSMLLGFLRQDPEKKAAAAAANVHKRSCLD